VRSDLQDQVVALITENLTRRQLDDFDPVTGTPLSAERWLGLTTNHESRLIDKLGHNEEFATAALEELVSFAATAVEMWAMYAGRDPVELVQAIASRRERDDPR
jgi:hypothetical protein